MKRTIERKLHKMPARYNITEPPTGAIAIEVCSTSAHSLSLSEDQEVAWNSLLQSDGPVRPHQRSVGVSPVSSVSNLLSITVMIPSSNSSSISMICRYYFKNPTNNEVLNILLQLLLCIYYLPPLFSCTLLSINASLVLGMRIILCTPSLPNTSSAHYPVLRLNHR